LHHPALPRVSDHFSEDDGQFLVMQFIPGDDLAEMMNRKRGPFPADQVLTWADQLLDALDYLHTQDPQIVHRDIKPQNLKLTSRGQIILLDFGLAKGQAGEISRVTASASIFGYTPNYAPLEQIQGLGTDPRSDLYSLAATLYHLMTGVKPPDALTRAASLVNGQPDPLVLASAANPAVGREVDQVLGKAMSQNREQRFASASEMRNALHSAEQASTMLNRGEAKTMLFPPPATTVPTQTAVKQETVATGETTVVRGRPRRKILPIALSAAVLLLVAFGTLGFFALQNRNERASQLAASSPTPVENASISPSPSPEEDASPDENEEEPDEPAPTPTKQDRARNEEPRKAATPKPQQDRESEGEGHTEAPEVVVPVTPIPPDFQDPGGQQRRRATTRVIPGGTIIRTLPDGSSIITMPDGMRVLVSKDGKRTVLNPPRPNRRRAVPAPTPAPSP
jgi:serine/threonine protein kinase